MDTVTQMLFGATVAQAGFRRRLGRKAMVAGALLGMVPDLDVVVGWVAGPFANWQYHRSLTHSLLFGPLLGPLFGWLFWRLHRAMVQERPDVANRDTLRAWIWLAILALLTHPLIDLFTSYGTQLLWPFTDHRFAINAMPIIDPLYSLVLVVALLFGSLRARSARAQDVAGAALLFIGIYSCMGWAINDRIQQIAAEQFDGPAEIDAYPLLFQPYYRRVVALTPDAAHVGYYSVLNPKPIAWQSFPQERSAATTAVAATEQAALFRWFAMDKLLWREESDGNGGRLVEATDLRYGLQGNADIGFWGIRARVGPGQEVQGPVEVFAIPRDSSRAAFRRFWAELTGW
ncbi:metal-dependent hydrolase [Geminicoccus harenae]|uniref:metal-dependent hydrolase n=1 Tax=Geminicoccus harenae TaxID=2498453 RepID=UPI00168AE88E|nr:metal-dependent hydrolase [Geminicoccus harenae]